jgi:hypothetical protein
LNVKESQSQSKPYSPTPEKSIQQLRREEQKRLEQGPQLPLFPVDEALEE